ncbi:unnamed protein product [Prorocentrum cordatum]|uniref:Uncharacterized protein n=1 Tax=Prorocentrum cordatum TaxID=2364126 RepID=A0ABN9R6H2_9DINO|nr:unnamed protein product [Polarella glacialis]
MSAFDGIGLSSSIHFDIYIDDAPLSKTGTFRQVTQGILAGARSLHSAITSSLTCKLAMDKIGVVTCHRSVAEVIHEQLGPLAAGQAKAGVSNLGIDAAAGKAARAVKDGTSLYRTGWSTDNSCTIADDFGREVPLALNSLRMVQYLCKESVRGVEIRRLVKIGQLVQAVLRWRYQRMEWREAHGRDPGALDAAVEPHLELGFCREKNNLLLRLVEGRGGPAECPRYYRERPEADRGGAPRRPPEEACAAQRARDELADTAGAADPEGCLAGARGRGRSPSCRGRARSLAGEPEGSVEPFRSRSEPPLGRRVPDLYDDPFEPPPQELWSTHAAAPPVPFASAGYAALAGPGAAAPPPCPLFLGVLVPAALLAAPTPARLAAGTRGDAAACKASSAPASPRPRPVLGAQGAPGARGA